jgi:hypothetical protein
MMIDNESQCVNNNVHSFDRNARSFRPHQAPNQTQAVLHIVTLYAKAIAYGAGGKETFTAGRGAQFPGGGAHPLAIECKWSTGEFDGGNLLAFRRQ